MAFTEACRVVQEQLESGLASDYGDTYIIASSKLRAESQIKRAICQLDPEGVEARRNWNRNQRRHFIIAGPNEL